MSCDVLSELCLVTKPKNVLVGKFGFFRMRYLSYSLFVFTNSLLLTGTNKFGEAKDFVKSQI